MPLRDAMEREVASRNALIRAWRACGIPIRGGWDVSDEPGAGLVFWAWAP